MKIRCAVIGNGRWAKIIIKNLELHPLTSVIYREDQAPGLNHYDISLSQFKSDIIFIATNPRRQIDILEKVIKQSGVVVIEKPIVIDKVQLSRLKKVITENQNRILADLTLCFHEKTKLLIENFTQKDLTSVRVWDGNDGPVRTDISPCLDWLPHSISLIQLYPEKLTFLRKRLLYGQDKANYAIELFDRHNKVHLKVITGNHFLKKKRKIAIEFEDGKNWSIDFTEVNNFQTSPVVNMIEAAVQKLTKNEMYSYTNLICDDMFIRINAAYTVMLSKKFKERNFPLKLM